MAVPRVMTGAIALVKVQGQVIGKMKTVRAQENFRRLGVRGLGTIMPSEESVTEWEGTMSCEFMEISFQSTGITNAIRRAFANVNSQVLFGNPSFEDQLVLDDTGVQVDIFKKVTDVINPITGIITPKLQPYASLFNCFIESDSFDINEGSIAGHSQSFKYLKAIVY